MRFRFENVCLESFGYTLPEEILTSEQIEAQLEPLYRRLRLPEGRLELMTGIRERRLWPAGTLPGQVSVASARRAIELAGMRNEEIGALIHASVCRDFLEPATACGVHHRLGLSNNCLIYDISNACLGFLNGLVQVANMIELGQIGAGVVVGTEGSRQLVESTIAHLNASTELTRADIKLAIASLTIGSASVAAVLCDRRLSKTGNRLLGGYGAAFTEGCELCHSGRDEAVADGMQPLMQTDSERLMLDGVNAAREGFEGFLDTLEWDREEIDKAFCHQVGVAHRKLLFDSLELPPTIDYPSVETLGNTGSAAVPVTTALGIENGHLSSGDKVALLGIGSGINVLMLGLDWQTSLLPAGETHSSGYRVETAIAAG